MEKEKFVSLDFLIAISSLIVAFGHTRFLMLVPSAEVTNISYVNKAIYFIAGFGPQAVIIFFVLSGFFITRSIDNHMKNKSFSLTDYFTDRYFRLSVVAIPAVILTLVLDRFSMAVLDSETLYFERLGDWLDNSSYSIETFLGNLFYLQTLFFNSFGSNGPLWSLAYEWWFYVLAPFLLIPFYGKKYVYPILFATIAIFLFFSNYKILIYFLYWFMGSGVYFISKKDCGQIFTKKRFLFVLFALVLISASLTRLRFIDKIQGDGLISASVALLIFGLIKNDIIKDNILIMFFTKISYSLYAVHLPLIIFIISIFPYFQRKLQPTFGNSLLCILVLSITILTSWVFYLIFEKNTNNIKRGFIKFFKK